MAGWTTSEDERFYAIGDIHGCATLFERLLSNIEDDVRQRERKLTKLVLLGDYIDRGPESSDVLDLAIASTFRFDAVVALRGNHEQWLLDALGGDANSAHAFFEYGGAATARSYGIDVPWMTSRRSNMKVISQLHRAMPSQHLEFLRSLEFVYSAGDYYFCHAGVRPGVSLKAQSPLDLMMIRNDFLNHPHRYEACIVHGHTPTMEVQVTSWRIGVDVGSYATNRLAAIRLEGTQQDVLYATA